MLHNESPSVVHQKCIDSLVESVVASEGIMTKDAYLKFVASRSEGLLDVESFSELPVELVQTYWQMTCTVLGEESICDEDSTVSLLDVVVFTEEDGSRLVHDVCLSVDEYLHVNIFSRSPSESPSSAPTISSVPSQAPSVLPSTSPTVTGKPTSSPSLVPTSSSSPSVFASSSPSVSIKPTLVTSSEPSVAGSTEPSLSILPSSGPSVSASSVPSSEPTISAVPSIRQSYSSSLSSLPSVFASNTPSSSFRPSIQSLQPTSEPSLSPASSSSPSFYPSFSVFTLPSIVPSSALDSFSFTFYVEYFSDCFVSITDMFVRDAILEFFSCASSDCDVDVKVTSSINDIGKFL